MNQDPRPDQQNGFRNFVSAVVFVARSLAVSVEVFVHKTDSFGERYLGLQAGAAMLLIFFWPVFCEPIHDPRPMLIFLLTYLAMCAAVRARLNLRARRGKPQPHTRYTGTPRLMRFTGRMDESKVKCTVEPAFVFLIGGVALTVSPPLGGYLMFASLGLLISNSLAEGCERQRTRDMHDAYLDQRRVVDRFRDLRRD
jgi:hypothetical protein